MIRTFRLVGLDEGGVQETSKAKRLVCAIKPEGKVAIWGSAKSHGNIDAVLKKGIPCTVECDCIDPAEWAKAKGHVAWVPEERALCVLVSYFRME